MGVNFTLRKRSRRIHLWSAKQKDPAAVELGRKGGKKGGPARAAALTPEQRSASARKAVQARWAKPKLGDGHIVSKSKTVKTSGKFHNKRPETTLSAFSVSKRALHACLKRIKDAKDDNELRRLTEELQNMTRQKNSWVSSGSGSLASEW
ncbi:MAG: hypothetical protein LAQ69_27170 [Acidobacteriia bacterium]|nr:hypothetical protein [Terriglobia bacterium]